MTKAQYWEIRALQAELALARIGVDRATGAVRAAYLAAKLDPSVPHERDDEKLTLTPIAPKENA